MEIINATCRGGLCINEKVSKDEMFGLISQSKRPAVSIPANIAEGIVRQDKNDTLQFLYVSRGSLYELETLLNVAVMVGIVNQEDISRTISLLQQCLKVLNGLIKYFSKAQIK